MGRSSRRTSPTPRGGTVDAGVVLDSAPYLFTLTGAAGIGLLLTLRRRHQK